MDFGQALDGLRIGQRLRRSGWNGKGMHVYLEPVLGSVVVDGEVIHFEPCFVMHTAQGKRQPGWLPSQADILAFDWEPA